MRRTPHPAPCLPAAGRRRVSGCAVLVSGCIVLAMQLASANPSAAQQVADPRYDPQVDRPAFEPGGGPLVVIDQAHHNFHTLDGRYRPFAQLLEADGFRVQAGEHRFDEPLPPEMKILVIANALHESNTSQWKLPTPSAFTEEEITAVVDWVAEGGSLLLIADHMPFPGAAGALAERFGVTMVNGFAMLTEEDGDIVNGALLFDRDAGRVADHPITRGRNDEERIDRVATFPGQPLAVDERGVSLLNLPTERMVVLEPDQAWQFDDQTKRTEVNGWSQGGIVEHGKGRVAIFGEAAMFTSQRIGNSDRTTGMTAENAEDNQQLLLNLVRWLSGHLEPADE